ncbi:aminoglycoside phosphotransferase family protein [Vulgatibacter incomptus]|uniref:aminoglycoside phosphotransferase family protein n=1 Tax=Vulgatibacter incomptus TaxID=1391653 RepID=UPI0014702223|nr:aminoglycoside phosphotransferase family protein [Vulgatibacter incomptus]
MREPVVVGGYSNTIVRLAPLPVVARIATGTSLVRNGPAWLEREVDVARHLAAADAPAVRPSALVEAGPHSHEGLTMTFWELVEIRPDPIDPRLAARTLRQCHEVLDGYRGALPTWAAIDEASRLLDHPLVVSALGAEEREVLQSAAERVGTVMRSGGVTLRPLHGDAHGQNLWNTSVGPIWGDWEDAFAGPAEWDLACLVSASAVLGDGSEAAEVLRCYGGSVDEAMLDHMIEARTLQAIVWAALLLPDAERNPKLLARLEWLRTRLRP